MLTKDKGELTHERREELRIMAAQAGSYKKVRAAQRATKYLRNTSLSLISSLNVSR